MVAHVLFLLCGCFIARGAEVLLPACQEAARRPRKSTLCKYQEILGQVNPENSTECTDQSLCDVVSRPLPGSRCNAPSESVNASISDGIVNRSFYVTLPGGCEKPASGWPFLLFFGFDINGIRSTRSLQSEILFIKEQLLSQGVAFVETSMYWNDTYDNRECNDFELGATSVATGTCRTCATGASPECEPLRDWFTCGNAEGARDITMMRNLFSGWQQRAATEDLNVAAMAYLGWSVGGHMVSRMLQMSAESSAFPVPLCGVMISGASYQCYSCPATRQAGDPVDNFERCNWYSQGAVANSSVVKDVLWPCGAPFGAFDIDGGKPLQNKNGVCPGYSLFPSDVNWWQMNLSAQRADDPLLTEAAWDTCKKSFAEHPPVLVAQPWEDSDAYWNLAASYYEVLAQQNGGQGCRMFAGASKHGPVPAGNLATVNFLLSYLASPAGVAKEVVV